MSDTSGHKPATSKPRRARKRADEEGSISLYASGKWRGRLMVGYKAGGKPDGREVDGGTEADLRRKLDTLRRRQDVGTLGTAEAERITVADVASLWLAAKESTVRPTTHALPRHHGPRYALALVDARRAHRSVSRFEKVRFVLNSDSNGISDSVSNHITLGLW